MTEPITALETRILRALAECDGPVDIEAIMILTNLPWIVVNATLDKLVEEGFVAASSSDAA